MSGDDPKVGRRGVLTGAGLLAGTALLQGAKATPVPGTFSRRGPGAIEVHLTVNGQIRRLQLEPRTTLAEALRDHVGLTGTKVGCDRGACGACTVHLDGVPVASCLTFAIDAARHKITTVEGLADGGGLSRLQKAFVFEDALQCGFCTPGMLMSCAAMVAQGRQLTEDEVRAGVSGNLCRCGTYPKVFEATLKTANGDVALPPPAAARLQRLESKKELSLGVEGQLENAARKIPEGEPPPWDGSVELASVGHRVPRLDGPDKVTGKAQYTFDVKLPGMLHAAVVRSPFPHARIKSIDLTAAKAAPGVRAAMAVERVLGPAREQQKSKDPYPRIRYEGQPLAAVAATTHAAALEAAALVRIDYEALPHVNDPDVARREGAPLVFDGPVEQPRTAGGGGASGGIPQKGNVRGPLVKGRPDEKVDIGKALKESENVFEETYRTQVQTHSAIEPHGVVAEWKDGELEVWSSTQGLFTVREELASLFEIPKSKVRVHCEFCGGGFGAKFGAGNYGAIAAQLSKMAKAPVRLFLDRRAEHLAAGNRPSNVQTLKLGCDKKGKLTAMHLVASGTAGCAAGAGCAGPVLNVYKCAAVKTEESDVFIHAGPAAAFRAPGHPQGAFALEQAMDELAEKIGLDPVVLRNRNDAHPARREERRKGAEIVGWAEKRKAAPGSSKGPVKRGVGFAQGHWYNFDGPPGAAEVLIHNDGTIECRSGVQDIGGGIRTVMAQVVAEELGVSPAQVHVLIGDTRWPQGPASGGSMTTQILLPAVRKAAFEAKKKLFAGAEGDDVIAAAKQMRGETVRGEGARIKDYEGWNAGPADLTSRIGGAQFAEVDVDVETGIIRVARFVAVHDCGRPVNRLTIESQINGGVIQGISFALFEDRILDRNTGRMVNPNLEMYKIAGARDVPLIEPVIIEHHRGRTNVDASGIGEPATVPTAAAVANAVYHAIGVRMRELPMTPARVLAALARKGGAR